MAGQVPCAWCGFNLRTIGILNRYSDGSPAASVLYKDRLRGLLTCGKCGEATVFEMTDGYGLSFLPGKDMLPLLGGKVPDAAKEMYSEARLCYFGAAYRAAAVMGRSCLEQALIGRGHTTGTLEKKVDAALNNGDLTSHEYALAHGSRLVGNAAIHESKSVEPAYLLPALAAAAVVSNHLWR
ncbi:MAG: DUF4145 domain-containing protein [Chloroflexi bacterium]|nr:DUF4145 domain-containing protein [Chloroflexota bacterium]